MKKILLLSLLVLSLSSCSDNEDVKDPHLSQVFVLKNTIIINNDIEIGNRAKLNYLFKKDYDGYYEIIIANNNFIEKDFSGEVTFGGFLINSKDLKIKEGTYTFSSDGSPNYDSKIHFFDGYVGNRLAVKNGKPELTKEKYYKNISKGEVFITKKNEEYIIAFDFTFENKKRVLLAYQGRVLNIK